MRKLDPSLQPAARSTGKTDRSGTSANRSVRPTSSRTRPTLAISRTADHGKGLGSSKRREVRRAGEQSPGQGTPGQEPTTDWPQRERERRSTRTGSTDKPGYQPGIRRRRRTRRSPHPYAKAIVRGAELPFADAVRAGTARQLPLSACGPAFGGVDSRSAIADISSPSSRSVSGRPNLLWNQSISDCSDIG
jgi:hypothetical protein